MNQGSPHEVAKGSGWFPTPTVNDSKNVGGGQSVEEEQPCPERHSTVADSEQQQRDRGLPGLAGGSGNRKKLYNMLGEKEGKKMGCGSLNPAWVEWLMGYPIGWTDLEDSEMP